MLSDLPVWLFKILTASYGISTVIPTSQMEKLMLRVFAQIIQRKQWDLNLSLDELASNQANIFHCVREFGEFCK